MYLLDTIPNRKSTPQSQPIPGRETDMVKNSAGGFVFPVSPETAVARFLILGSEAGSYYASSQDLTKSNTTALVKQIKKDGVGVVKLISEISDAGRAVKNEPALFALALCLTHGNEPTKRLAGASLLTVARTGTHILHFVAYMDALRGWGRCARESVAAWYTKQDPNKLAYQLVKYPSRDGWSHKDVLRLAHPKASDNYQNQLFKWVAEKGFSVDGLYSDSVALPLIAEAAKTAGPKAITKFILEKNLPWEAVPTDKRTPEAYKAYLSVAPVTWILRNLGSLTKHEVLKAGSWDAIKQVQEKIVNPRLLKQGRVHPLSVLVALNTYRSGSGVRSGSSWTPVPSIVSALEDAFYAAFHSFEPTGLRIVNALDVSGSMGAAMISGMGISARTASAAMSMISTRLEPKVVNVGFTGGFYSSDLTVLPFTKNQDLKSVENYIDRLPFGGTDCAIPMIWAKDNKVEADLFVVYTDCETWAGGVSPSQALAQYRQATGIPAKLVVVGMTANNFTLADPKDAGMMDVVGFDTSAPQAIAEFAKGF